jgi:hypothetical protein
MQISLRALLDRFPAALGPCLKIRLRNISIQVITVKLGYNELGYNELGYNELGC